GRATFSGPQTLEVEGHGEVAFRKVIIATGSSPWVPPPYRHMEDHIIVNDDLFDWEDLPESVCVVGAGVIGLELGQALHRLGVRVMIVGVGGGIGPLSDPEVLAEAREVLGAELNLHPHFDLEEATATPDGVRIRGTGNQNEAVDATFETLLVAAGRRPNLRGLELERAGVTLNARGLPAEFDSKTLQVGNRPIFMAGDVNNTLPLLHEAADDGKLAGRNAVRFPHVQVEMRRTPLAVMFTDPQVGLVGKRFSALKPGTFAAGSVSYRNQGRARVMAVNYGKVRIYADAESGVLLGAEMFGPRMEHMAHLLAWTMQQRLTCKNVLAMPFYHPVLEEGLRTALQDLEHNMRLLGPLGDPCEEVGPGA
ncbi:MAG: dihydrolipoyl dehydrogenase, partial [Myxococcota bacterium]